MPNKPPFHEASQTVQETAKLLPPLTIGGTGLIGVDWQTWVLIFTAIYTALLILQKILHIYKDLKRLKRIDDSRWGDMK